METSRRSGPTSFSRRIVLRLEETNRSEEAAAFLELAGLQRLLDMLIQQLDGSSERRVIVDFEHIVANIGELSLFLQRKVHGEDPMSDTQKDLLRLCSGPTPGSFERIPVADSLNDLEPVGELSEAYAHPDFSDRRSKSSEFLRK
jgi:hypothetical protein